MSYDSATLLLTSESIPGPIIDRTITRSYSSVTPKGALDQSRPDVHRDEEAVAI